MSQNCLIIGNFGAKSKYFFHRVFWKLETNRHRHLTSQGWGIFCELGHNFEHFGWLGQKFRLTMMRDRHLSQGLIEKLLLCSFGGSAFARALARPAWLIWSAASCVVDA